MILKRRLADHQRPAPGQSLVGEAKGLVLYCVGPLKGFAIHFLPDVFQFGHIALVQVGDFAMHSPAIESVELLADRGDLDALELYVKRGLLLGYW